MAFKPIPTDRLSILTDKPNKRKPAILKIGLSSSFDEDIIKSIPIYDKIMVAIRSILIKFILLKRKPKLSPKRRNIKCYAPTIRDINIFSFSLILVIPYARAREKASILRLIPINRIVIKEAIIFTYLILWI